MGVNVRAETIWEKPDEKLIECGKYYDVLDNFDKTVQKLNKKAADGEEGKRLQNQFLKLFPAFILLCGGDVVKEAKKPVQKPKPKTVLNTNLKVKDGWGICPTCGKRCIKVHDNTILVNYPMFCKVCRRDYSVTWKMEK